AAARLGDHLLRQRADRLGLGERGLDAAVLDERGGEVGQDVSLVLGRAPQPGSLAGAGHQAPPPSARLSPSSSSLAVTSSRLFCPKLVMLSRSSPVRCTSSPTVLI